MTLSFSQTWGKMMGELAGQPNYFVDNIWNGLLTNKGEINSLCADMYYEEHIRKFGYGWYLHEGNQFPKLHTIREDKHDRWKAGNKIHFVINNRTKNRFQFAPVIECVSVQKIEIHIDANDPDYDSVKVDGVELWTSQIQKLAINDGFPSFVEFFDYFNKDFKGKIIHWTDLKY